MMSPTIIDMPADARSAAGLSLQAATQRALSLHLDAKQAHWNVQGPTFIGLHKMFDKVADFGLSLRDGSAELARSMGMQIDARAVPGTAWYSDRSIDPWRYLPSLHAAIGAQHGASAGMATGSSGGVCKGRRRGDGRVLHQAGRRATAPTLPDRKPSLGRNSKPDLDLLHCSPGGLARVRNYANPQRHVRPHRDCLSRHHPLALRVTERRT